MPSERHIDRQVQWRTELRKYGCNASLERTIYIRGARVVVDVYAETEGKIFLIEVGNIEDERKTALIQYYAENNPNMQFIHENYGENKIPKVLESITIYRNSPEYEMERKLREYRQKNVPKPTWSDLHFKFFLGIVTLVIVFLQMLLVFLPVAESETAPLARSVPAKLVLVFFFLAVWGLVSKYLWSHRNTFEHTRYDEKLEQELSRLGNKRWEK